MKKKLLAALTQLAMRLMISQVLVLLSVLTSYATDARGQEAFNRKFSISVRNTELKAVLEKIQAVTDVKFVFSPSIINVKRKLNFSVQEKTIGDFLSTYMLSLGIGYKSVGNLIILYNASDTEDIEKISTIDKITNPDKKPADRQISGFVRNEKGEPVAGATIVIQGTTIGTHTDTNGHFSLAVPGNETVTLQISFVGFQTQTIEVNSSTASVKITMGTSIAGMDEVVVIGYGQVRKKDLTGSIVQVRPDKIANENPNTVQDVLRGTPGLSIGFDPSAKGGGSVLIRGQRSVYTAAGRNEPLIVLDGMIFYGELSEINPDDISQIDVLKDASASAIYGAKSANGVLIITTKKGQKGKPRINFTSTLGLVSMGAHRRVFGPEGYMQYRRDWYTTPTYGVNPATGEYEAYVLSPLPTISTPMPGYFDTPTEENLAKYGITQAHWRAYTASQNGSASDEEIWAKRLLMQDVVLNNFLAKQTFDWYDHSFRTGINQDYNISASGASETMNYYMSLGYLTNQGVAKGNNYKAIRSNIKVEGKITKWLELGANINFQNRTDADMAVDWESQIIRNAPFASYKDANGKLMHHPMGETMSNNYGYNWDFDRQYRDMDRGFTVFNTIITSKIKLPFNITYSFNASPRFQYFHDRWWESASHPDPVWRARVRGGLVNREQTKRFDWSLNNTINWEKTFAGAHRFNLTLVQESEKRQSWQDRVEARNLQPSDALGYHETIFGDKALSVFNAEDIVETADGMLARLFYSYNDRYMLTTSFRRDGYSAFGSSNPRANFFSAGLAWVFTSEKFFKWEPLTTGKLRLSWGQSGNRALANPYLALADLSTNANATMGYLDASGTLTQLRYLTITRLANPNLTWEKTVSFNAGLDVGFLNNRITGTIDYFITPTVDMIMNQTLPPFTGFGSIITNLGKVDNRGFELTINSQNIRSKDFNWNTTFGFSMYKNTIEHLYYTYENIIDAQGNVIGTREIDDIGNGWFIGQPISAIWDYRVTGIWQANEAGEAAQYGQRPGDPKVANNYTVNDKVNAAGPPTPVYDNNDKEFLGQTAPPVMGSLRNDFNYKNLTFSFNLYSYWGHKSLNDLYMNQDNGISLVTNLANSYAKDYWTLENPTNDFARLDAKGPAGLNRPGKVYDRSFIRLENITVGYTVPAKLLSRVSIEKLKVYAGIRNVAVWAKDKNWQYWDIETGGLAPRTFNFGLNVNF
jgi:TonB-linked SusC/RagA family outer membrane protein